MEETEHDQPAAERREADSRNLTALPPALTIAQLQSVLQIGRRMAYELVADGSIRSIRVGRSIRVPKDSVLAFLAGPGSRR